MKANEQKLVEAIRWMYKNNGNIKLHQYGGRSVNGGTYDIRFRHGVSRKEDYEFQDLIEAIEELKRRIEYDASCG